MDNNKEKARKYAEVMETELVSVSDYCEAMDNIMLAMGICYNKEGDSDKEMWEAACEAYEAEFRRLGIPVVMEVK
jgi:hypothetical protein